jgi:Na+/melibiose symporter-like transporter
MNKEVSKEKYEAAKKRVESIKGFYVHLGIYLAVNLMLMILNLVGDGEDIWFHWTALFWGFGLAIHGMGVFFFDRFTKDWEERKIRELLEKESKQ